VAPLSSRAGRGSERPADANASIHSNAATVGALVAATVHSLHRHGSRRAAEALPGEGPALQEHAGPRRPQTGQHDGCAGRQSARGGLGVLFGAGCEVALTSLSTLRAAIPTLPLPPPLPAAHVLDNPARMAVAFGIPPPLPSLELTWPSPSYSPLDEPLLPTPRTLSLCGIIQARGS